MAALAYPILMVIIGSILITVLMIGVVPKVTTIFASLDRALPWYTAVLIGVSDAFSSPISHGLLTGGLVGASGYMLAVKPSVPLRAAAGVQQARNKAGDGRPSMGLAIGSFLLILQVFMRESATKFVLAVVPGVLLGAALGSLLAWMRTDDGRVRVDGAMLTLPIFGPLFQMIAVARFAKTLSTLLASGVQLLRAMDIVRAVIGNAALERVVEDAINSIREGESIAEPLKRSKQFPPIVTHMIAVGEKSGQLESMLEAVSDSYESAVEIRITALTSLLEPMMIVIMGGAVGFIAFSILMPLIQMNDFNQ
jgi:general secretion pathway protein F